MTEEPLDETEYGKLVWPRFYGPSIEYNRAAYSKYLNLTLMVIASGLFLATGLLIFLGSGDARWGLLNITIAIGIPVFYWWINRNARTSMDYESMRRRGDLDWDLYENGFLTREYSAAGPGHMRSAFVGFDRFSKAYVNIDRQNARVVWELAKASARKARKARSEEDVGPDFIWDDHAEALVARSIWFVGRESGRADFRLDREQLSDPARLETVLRQKIKDVE